MRIVTGNIWDEEGVADVILITTNAIINARGQLVMGRGAALEAAQRYPSLPFDLAEKIKAFKPNKPYGVLILPQYANGVQLGAFQVKHHWRDSASLELIKLSTRLLVTVAEICPDMKFALNYPGIGNGRLVEAQVFPIISVLPNNVTIYKKM